MKRFIIDVKEPSQTDHPGDSGSHTPNARGFQCWDPPDSSPSEPAGVCLDFPHTPLTCRFLYSLDLGFPMAESQMSHSTETFILGAVTQERT